MKTGKILRCVIAACLVILFTFSSVLETYAAALADDAQEQTGKRQATVVVTADDPSKNGGKAGKRYVWDDGGVRVTAVLSDGNAIPDDAQFVVKAIDSTSVGYDYDAYMEALNACSDFSYDENNTLLFDVAFIKDGVELQPAKGSVSVTFKFLDNQLSELIGENGVTDVNVVHLSLSDEIRNDYDKTADAVDIGAGNIDVEKLTAGDNKLQVNVDKETVTFETTGFSVFAYTVDFEYSDPSTGKIYKYSIKGAESISLMDLAVILGITTAEDAEEFVSGVANVEFSDETLVRVVYTPEDGWVLESLKPFSTKEKLTVTMKDGTVINIRVTDVQESSDLADFLANAVIVGAIQNDDGSYSVVQGQEYSFILSFAEDSTCQFANDATLTYQIPEGIVVNHEQSGSLTINIVYNNRTYQVDANYTLTTDGLLSITFDQTDPDYPRLVDSTNVSFRYMFYAEFDGEESEIRWSEDIERDIIFEDPDPGQAFAEKTAVYDETTGTFHYTITVTATGDVADVLVKDTVLGDALIVDPASVVITGNSSSYTGGMSADGFEYTFASMREGEVITIEYDAAIDFSKDTDGDGKITADQTKNSVSIDSEPGDPHNSDYSREITYKYTVKKDGTEAGVTSQGDKIIDWEIEYNPLALVAVGGDTVTDVISGTSAEFMKYYGSGITVDVYDKEGNLVETRNVDYSDLTNHSDSTWTYTIPETDTTPYSYVIRYQTIVDMAAVAGHGVGVDIDNTANGDHGAIHVAPENEIEVNKEVESYTTEEITWNTTFSIPQDGLAEAVVTDYLPRIFLESGNYYDLLKEGTLEITGLLPGESYEVTYGTGSVVIKFFKDEEHNQEGLQPFPGGRNVNVRLTTKTNQDWLQIGYETGGYEQGHTNSINLNGKFDTAQVIYGKPGLEKTVETPDPDDPDYQKVFKYSIFIKGLKQDSITITDTFDTALLEVDTSKIGEFDHMRIYGGTQWSQTFPFGGAPVSYTDTENGIIITANSIPKDASDQYYSYYRIDYYLKLKEGVDLEQFAIANGGEYDVINNALWADHETECTYKVVYDALNKELLNAGELGDTNRTAQYRVTFNTAKATLNNGEPMTMKDVLSANMSLDYSSVRIVTDPPGVSIPYSISGGRDEFGNPDGTTVATYTIPDATKVIITYNAEVRGDGTQTIVNKVTINGYSKTDEHEDKYGDIDEGSGAVASFKILKVDGYDANKKLPDVSFRIFAENPNLDFGLDDNGNPIKELILTTDENGEIILDGDQYTFFFNETYHVREIEPLENYGTIGFDYLVTLTNDMALVDYGHYIYYFSDTMQIKNWPLEGLVVEKQVESDDDEDMERYYTFRVSILNADGTVNTDYNEKNGDDQFVNGVTEFQIKNSEQKMFWGFTKGTRYLVEEIDADGFAVTYTYSVFDEDGNVVETVTESGTSHIGALTQETEVIVFKNSKNEKGSLKIKKNVTVNGKPTTGTSADGTYTFIVTGPDGYESTQTIVITNGVSNEVTIEGLEPGTYTVTEDTENNPDGMSLVGANGITAEVTANNETNIPTAEFTNNKVELGSLKIKKNVTVNGKPTTGTSADGTYTFIVTGPDGYESTQTIVITNGVSNEVTIEGLEPGTYTVTEDTENNPDGMSLVGANGITAEVTANNETNIPTAEFTNNKVELGSLKIKKNVTVNGKPTTGTSADGTYTFIVTGPDGYESTQTIVITNGVSNEVTIEGLEPGTYTVTEDTENNPDGMSLVGANGITAEVTANNETNIPTAEFTNNKVELGSLKIKKNVTVNGKPTTGTSADGTYTFIVTGPDGYESTQTIVITNGVSNEVTIEGLEPGTYTVTEDTENNPDGMSLVGANGITAEVTANNETNIPTAEFTNNKVELGSLKIKKNVTVNGKPTTGTSADGTYTFIVTGPDGYESTQTIVITNGVSNEVTIEGLEPGTYTVTEDTENNPDGMSLVGANGITAEVTANNETNIPTAEFTNNKVELGSLKIKKNVTVNGKPTTGTSADGTYTFIVTGPDGYESTQTIVITNGVSNEVTIEGLEPGTYTVTEDTENNPDGMSLVGANGITAEVTANNETNIPTAEFTNNKVELGSLKIKKNVTVNGKPTTGTSADGTYTFIVTGPDGYESTQTIVITNGVSNEVTIEGLEPGTYTVTEDTENNPDGMSLVGANGITAEVTANNETNIPTAEFTNNKVELGSLKIKKNVTVNGKPTTGTSADGTYTFIVTGPDGYESTQTIVITNGVSNEVTIEGLEPGTYTVTEDTENNPDGMSLVGANGITAEVTANNETNIPTAEFTNNKVELGSLKIKKNVTVNGKPTTGTSADGTYTFIVTGPDGYESTQTIVITNGVSNEVTIEGLEPGTYTVTEDTENNPDGMSLVGANGITAEVTANNETNIPTAEFTNNKVELGSLKIKKNVTVNGKPTTGTSADGTYTFIVTGPDGYESTQTIVITNGVSNEVTIEGLEPGTYTVTEDTENNPDGMSLVGANGITAEVTANNETNIPTAEFTNNKVELGSLKIKKNVTVNGKPTTGTSADGTYTFIVTGPDGYESTQTIVITNGVSNEVTIEGLEPGTYTVTEDTENNPDGMSLVGANGITAEVTANNETNIPTAEFTNNKVELGSLKIKKNVTVNGKPTTGTSADGTYTFIVTGPDGYESTQTIVITNGVSNEVTIEGLEPGTYTVTEDTENNPDGMSLVGANGITAEVTANNETNIPTAEFTNNKVELGSLKIKKNVTVNGKPTTGTSADGTYTFIVTGPDGYESTQTIVITNGVSNEVTIEGLEPGTYTVTEDTENNPDGMSLVGANGITAEVTANNETNIPTAEFTNNKVELGSLKIKKNVTVNGKPTTGTSADGTYTFIVTGPDGYESTQTIVITNGVSNEVTIEGLEPGTYTVTEDTENNPDGMSLVGANGITAEVTANNETNIPTAEFTNNKVELGSLKIKKNVTVNGKPTTGTSADGTYTFIVTGPDGYESTQTIVITNGVSNEVTIEGLEPGTYTVTEDTENNPDGMSLVGANGITAEVTANNETNIPTAEFTNNKVELGSLKIKKNVTVNGKPTTGTSADGTYTFIVTGPDGYESTQTIVITNGVSNEVTIEGLEPGTYTVTEDTENNPDGMSLVGANGITAEVTANNETNIPTAEFTNNKVELGSLKIKKNVTVNGKPTTGTSADGTYTFIVTGPDGYESTQTIVITNGVSNEVTIEGLEPGTYTVTEDTENNPDGMSLVGANGITAEVTANNETNIPTAEFTNNKVELGSLKIKKNVTVNGKPTTGTSADGTYTFIVTGPDGYESTQTIVITNGVSNEVTIEGLEPGTYTVTEDTENNPDGMSLVGANGITAEVTANNETNIPTAEFTNNKVELGSLKIKKNVTVNGKPTTGTSADGTYTFIVTGPDGYESTQTIVITNGVSNEVTIEGLEPGTYTVTEDTENNPDGMSLVGANGITAEVTANNETNIPTAEFTNNKVELGSLKIKKNVTVNGKPTTGTSADGTYTFIVTGPDGYESTQTIVITNGVSNEVTIEGLEPGTYTVTEDTENNPDGMSLVGANGITAEVTANNETNIPTAEFTNNKVELGSLKIKKNVTVNGKPTTGTSADGTYTFIVTGPDGYESTQTIVITNGVSNEVTIEGLEPGTYTVTEDTENNPDGMSLVGANGITAEVTANNETNIPTAEFTNNKVELGSLKIKKNVTVNGKPTTGTSADGTYTFIVTGPDGYESTQTIVITNGVSNEVTIEGLEPGTYTVTEDTENNPDGMSLVGANGITAEVTANNETNIPTAEFTNNKVELGSLKIKKNVTVNGKPTTGTSADGTYTFIVTGPDGYESTQTIVITNGVSNEVTIEGLEPGTYTVTEDTENNPDGMSLVGANGITAEVTANNETNIPTAEFTNNKVELGSLKIKKNVTVNGKPTTGTSADGTYTFIVTGPDGYESTQTIVITNGVSNEVTIEGLEPGTYTVTEDTENNPDGMSLVGANGITAEVTANNETNIPTAEFTNNKVELGSLKIKKNVTVNGKPTTGTSADGTYTFIVTGPDGYESTQTIVITNGVSNEVTIEGLEPGTYTVTEDTENNPDGMSLVGANGITAEVTANNETNIPTAEFTNNKVELGSLKIKKNVTVNGKPTTGTSADGTYTFIVTGPDGYESTQTIVITNGVSNEVTIEGLEPGTYTVTEDTENNPDGMSLVGANGITAEVTANNETNIPTAEFTNNKVELGSLKIKKNVTVNGKPTTGTSADGTYTFIVTGPDGYESTQTIVITNGVSNEVTIEGLEPGTYTVTEDTENNPDGMSLVGANGITAEVTANNETNIPTAEFTNNKVELGSLKIKKNVTVNGKPTTGTSADGTYTFIVTGPDGYESTQTIVITNGVSNEVTIEGLEPGTYTVTEDTENNPDGMSLVGANGITAEVTANNETNIPTAEFTNNKVELGSLKIKKNVTVNGKPTTGTSADGTYTFIVTGPDGYESTQTIVITNGVSNEVTIEGLEPGTYTVTEDTENNPDGMSLVGANGITAEVTANNETNIPTAEFTNNKVELGSLKIKKNVTVNGKPTTGTSADGTYTFIVTGPDGYESTQTIVITNGVSNEVTIEGLEPGTYTVTEDTENNPDGMSLVGANGITAEVTANNETNIPTAEFTNNKVELGSLKIKKNVTVNGKPTTGTSADGTYTFIVTGPDGYESTQTIVITNGVSNEVTIEGLEPGTYTVTEDTENNPDGMSLVGANGITAEVTANNETNIPTAEFTNNKVELGSLKIKKNVTVNGKPTTGTSADGTYTFIVTGPDGYESTQTIVITNGVSNEVTIEGLEPGTYTVTEDTENNPDGMSLVGANGITAEVTANNETNIPTAEFTNNKVELGSLKIKKNVTVNGKPTTGTSADGTYTFIVTGPDGYESTQTIVITNGVSNEVTIEGLEPGTYTVTEDTENNPDGMSLVGANGITAEVTANNETNIPTAEFTNNKVELGSLKIKKNVTVNGKPTTGTSADGTYTFIVTGPDGYESTQTIVITNGVSNEVTIEGLEPGTYTVTEDTENNPDGMSLVGANGITAEVTANNETNIPTAEFTNNKEVRTISLPVRKEWAGKPTKNITVELLADGIVIQKVKLSNDNNWNYTFTDLPRYDDTDGHEIVYTVEEEPIKGYTYSISGDMKTGFVILNTETPPPPPTGDADLPLYILMMILSGLGMIGIISTKKKRRRLE